jgi:hypothetical protein
VALGSVQNRNDLLPGNWVIAYFGKKFLYALVVKNNSGNSLISLRNGNFDFISSDDEDVFYILTNSSIVPDMASMRYVSPYDRDRPPPAKLQLFAGATGTYIYVPTDHTPLRFSVSSGEIIDDARPHYFMFDRWKLVETKNHIEKDLFTIEPDKSSMDVKA